MRDEGMARDILAATLQEIGVYLATQSSPVPHLDLDAVIDRGLTEAGSLPD